MKQETLATIAGRTKDLSDKGMVNTPVHRTSTVLFKTLKDYHDARGGKNVYQTDTAIADFSYGLTGTPTTFTLQRALAELEGADHAIVVPSGLAAITTVLLAFLDTGDHFLMSDSVYGPGRRFAMQTLKRLGIEVTFYDPLIGSGIKDLIKENTKIVFTESPGSMTFEVQDIPAIAKEAHAKGAIVVMDNSWATSLYFKPFEHGVDISVQAGTKYIGGHSDIFLGTITCKEAHIQKLFRTYHNLGLHTSPDVCYMATRGLRSMAVRLKQHEETALNIAKWLKKRKEVSRVLHPALPSCPGHKIWKRDFTGSTGLFTVVLDKTYPFEAVANMIDNMEIFKIGESWGGFESLMINCNPAPARTAVKWEEKNTCLRIYAGLEAEEDLIKDIEAGLRRLK